MDRGYAKMCGHAGSSNHIIRSHERLAMDRYASLTADVADAKVRRDVAPTA